MNPPDNTHRDSPENGAPGCPPPSPPARNRGLCVKCGGVTPAHHETRDGKVFLVKECPHCGSSEAMVSSNAARYYEKREMLNYRSEAENTCSLLCAECVKHKDPTLVFIDVTNRCNMNCPICLANIPAMGFRFDPPMRYFEKIFQRLSRFNPKPKIQLFGGEPTVREDLIEIINLARKKYGFSARVVTNGLRLADDQYCQELVKTGTQIMFSFDGDAPEIYEQTRKSARYLKKKIKAIENLAKSRRSKITVMCCSSERVNGDRLGNLVEFCHEHRHVIAALDLIPLTATWGPETIDAESATIEDVESMMVKAAPGLEFFPAGMMFRLKTLRETFDAGRLTFGGAHPNCESVSFLISDGTRYHPPARYLKKPLKDVVMELLALDEKMGKRFERGWIAGKLGPRGRRFLLGWALFHLARRSLRLREVFGGNPLPPMLAIARGLWQGKKAKDLLRRHTACRAILRLIILPFEEPDSVESARLVDCPAQFAYEHPETREIRFMPVCAWAFHKNRILRATSENYGVDAKTGSEGLDALAAEQNENAEDEETA